MQIVIRAGGVGTRLWPWSRSDRPKQFLPLFVTQSPVQAAYDRFVKAGLVTPDQVYVSVGKESLDLALEQLPALKRDQFIVEPALRDTSAAIGLETICVTARAGDCIIASLGSDHYVARPGVFVQALRAAESFLEQNPDYLVTIACEPTRVETNYGHVRKGDVLGEFDGVPVHQVAAFTEKPDTRIAEEYTASGDYLWNANFFVWSSRTLMDRFKALEPEMHAQLMELAKSAGTDGFREALRTTYPTLKRIAVDYAILEPTARAGKMAVIPAAMGWSDIGSWATLTDAFPPDADGNLIMGPAITEDTTNTTIFSRNPDHTVIATIGVDGLAVVDMKDALLICPKDQCGKVKRLVERMRESSEWKDLV